MAKMIDDCIVENKLCPMEYWTTSTKKTDQIDNYNLKRSKDDPQTKKKHDPQTPKKGREADTEEEDGFIMISNKKAARSTPPIQARPAAPPARAAATTTPQRKTILNHRAISSPSDEDENDNDDDEVKENKVFTRVNEEEDYSDEGDEDSEASTESGLLIPRRRLTRELRALGVIPPRSTGTENQR
jgi:hypothetical protein